MSRFNTGNPLGSGDPRDLDDNAKNMDLAVNSEELSWRDRFGRDRKSFEGMEQEFDSAQDSREARFNDFISSSGYQFLGDYGPGIEFTEYNQLVRDENGEFWRLSGQVELPYVTTGAGIPEGDALVPAGDAVLRQEIRSGIRRAISIDDMSASPGRFPGDGTEVVGGGIPGTFRWVAEDISGSVADGNRQAFIPAFGSTLESGGWVRLSGSIDAAVTIIVGDGLYFDTINKALDLVSGWQMGGEGRVRIILASGYVMREQIVLNRGRDLSFVEITAEDDEVIVDREFINVPTPGGIILVSGAFQAFGPALFAATEQAKLPVIGAKFRFNTSGSGTGRRVGIRVAYGASVVVRRGCGVLDSPTEGLTAIHGAHAIAAGANFSGAGSNGVTSYRGSSVDFRDGIADNAGLRGAYVGSNSRLEALNSSFKNAAEWGVEAYGASIAHVRNTDVSGAGRDGFYARDGAVISSRDPIINDVVRHGIHTENGGRVYASGASILRAGQRAVSAFDGGYVNVQGATIEDCGGDALYANRLSEIQADEVEIKRAGAITISCDRASTVNAAGSVIEDSTGLTISCRRSGRVAADSSTILMNGPKDLALVREGGEVSLTSSTVSTAFATAIRATTKSGIAAAGLKVNGAGSASFYASAASTLDLDGAQFTTTGLTYVQSSRGSVVNVDGATSSNGISLVVARGGVIAASSAVASTNVATNAIHPEGVIYQDTQPEPE